MSADECPKGGRHNLRVTEDGKTITHTCTKCGYTETRNREPSP